MRTRGGSQLQFGRYHEEFEVGVTYEHWPGTIVTEQHDHPFCLLTIRPG